MYLVELRRLLLERGQRRQLILLGLFVSLGGISVRRHGRREPEVEKEVGCGAEQSVTDCPRLLPRALVVSVAGNSFRAGHFRVGTDALSRAFL